MSLEFMVLYKTRKTTSHFHSGEIHKLFYCKPCPGKITRQEGGKSRDVFHLMHRLEAKAVYRETKVIL